MRVVKYLVKLVLLLLLALAIYTVLVGWTNLWVQPHQVGLLYIRTSAHTNTSASTDASIKPSTDANISPYQAPILIPDKGFTWKWHRVIPFQSTLAVVPLTLQYAYIPYQVRLPNAVLYSTFIQKPVDTFDSTGDITIAYSIDSKKIASYAHDNHLMYTQDIQSALMHTIQTSMLHAITGAAPTTDAEQTLGTHAITQYLQTLPIIVHETSLVPYTQPDLTLYRLAQEGMQTQLDASLSNNGQSQSTQSSSVAQYLLLIKQLSDLSRDNPTVLETLKMLPYKDIIPLIERQ